MGQTNVKNLGNGGTMDGDVTITGDLTVSGGISLSLNEVLQGTSTIDINSTEALLVRKDGDGGDVFIVDTTNSRVGVGIAPSHELTVNNQIGIKRDGTNAFGTLTFDSSGLVLDQSASGYSPLKIKSNGSEIARFTSDGKVGIGTTSPSKGLSIESANSGEGITMKSTATEGDVQMNFFADNGDHFWTMGVDGTVDKFVIDNSSINGTHFVILDSGNVGIGENSPDQLLHLKATNGSQVLLQRTSADTSSILGAINFGASDGDEYLATIISQHDGATDSAYLAFQTEATGGAKAERMRIDSSGNVGIGTDNPAQGQSTPISDIKLDVAGNQMLSNLSSTNSDESKLFFFRSDGAVGSQGAVPDGLKIGAIEWTALTSGDNNNSITSARIEAEAGSTWSSAANRNADITFSTVGANTLAERMRINSNGVGIGTDNPATELHLKGSGEILRIENELNASGNTFMSFYDTSALKGYLGFTGGSSDHYVIYNNENADLRFFTNATHYMTLNASGNLGIGDSTPDDKLSVYGGTEHIRVGSADANHLRIGRNTSTGAFEILRTLTGVTNQVIFQASEADSGNISFPNGSLGIGTTSPTASKLSISHANNTDYDSYKSNMGATASTHHAVNISNSSNEDNTNERYALLNFFSSYGNSASGQAIIGNVSTGSKQGNFIIGTRGGDSDANVTEKFRVTYDGNVGIGNSGTFDNPNSASKVLEIATSSPVGLILNDTRDANPFCIENRGAVLHFAHGTTSRLIIDDSGNVGIGASPQTGFTQNLTIEGASPALILRDSTSSNQATQFYTVYTANNAVKHYFDHAGSLNFASSTDYAGSGEAIRFKIDDNSRISLSNNDSGSNNTTFGYQSGLNLTTNGDENTLVGHASGVELTTGEHNVAVGHKSIFDLKEGSYNTAVGSFALGGSHGSTADASVENVAIGYSTMGNNFNNSATTDQCVAIGAFAMNGALNNVDGTVAVGYKSLLSLTSGVSNVAVGYQTGDGLTDGGNNVLIGYNANSAGGASASQNIGIGVNALLNASASNTVGIGYSALSALTSGERNTAVGFESLKSNTIGDKNTAVGYQALESFNADTDGHGHNTAVGHNAMQGNVTGTDNTAIGHMSAFSGTNNMTAGDNNTFVGSSTSPSSATPTNQTVIGYNAVGQADNSVTLGNSSVTAVYMSEDSGATVHANGLGIGLGGSAPATELEIYDSTAFSGSPEIRLSFLGSGSEKFHGGMELKRDGTSGYSSKLDFKTSVFSNNISTKMSLLSSGVLSLTAGIQFPATQNASADANTLDDYEEGTFTPTWVSGSGTLGSINYSNQVGKYTKIGNAVTITISFYNGAFDAGTGSGSLKITGLPFTSGAKSSLALGDTRLFGGDNPSEAEVTNSSTNVTLYFRTASNGANSELQVSDAGTGSGAFNLVTLSGTYFV